MQRLTHRELKAVSEALVELYSPAPYAEFPARLIALSRRLFSCENYCYNEFDRDKALRFVHEPAYGGELEVFNHYVGQHPLAIPVLKHQVPYSVKISDFATLRHWQRSDLYNNFFRLEGLNHQLVFLSPGPLQVGMALNRARRDFSETERAMLDLLAPHITQAYRNSKLFSLMSDANESAHQGWIVANSSGRILSGSAKALGWLTEYFGPNGSLPSQLLSWLKRRVSALLDTNGANLTLEEFSVPRGSTRLIVRSLSPVDAEEHRLVLREISEEFDAKPLEELGLTKREAEVLLWVSQGKRNSEIAVILGTTAKTITKHLERIFAKLSVETRTSAANIALRVLGRTQPQNHRRSGI